MQKSAENQCFSNTEINNREGDGMRNVAETDINAVPEKSSPKGSGNIIYVLEVGDFQGGQILGYVVGQSYL